jgi:DivIVA domain-containing protein
VVPLVVLALVGVVLVVAVLGVARGRLPADPLADAVHSTPDSGLPPAPVAADVDDVRFDTALRGYRMEDVDVRLETLRDDLAERERELAGLGVDPTADPPEGSLAEPDDPADPTGASSPGRAPGEE